MRNSEQCPLTMRLLTAPLLSLTCCGAPVTRHQTSSSHCYHAACIILLVITSNDVGRVGRRFHAWGAKASFFTTSPQRPAFIAKPWSSPTCSTTPPSVSANKDDDSLPDEALISTGGLRRRDMFKQTATIVGATAGMGIVLSFRPPEAHAGEVGARITKAVTTSELGISVRRAVVQGAQVVDSVDAQWEQFSDRFGLGAARRKNNAAAYTRPLLSTNDDSLWHDRPPLDVNMATKLLDISNEAFLDSTRKYGIHSKDLQEQISEVAQTVWPSFARAGSSNKRIDNGDDSAVDATVRTTLPYTPSLLTLTTRHFESSSSAAAATPTSFSSISDKFNFLCYAQYKAYLDLILQSGSRIDFPSFSNEFESRLGNQVLNSLLVPSSLMKQDPPQRKQQHQQSNQHDRNLQLAAALNGIDELGQVLVAKGFLSRIDSSLPPQRRPPGEANNNENSNSDKTTNLKRRQQQHEHLQQEEDVLDWSGGLTDYLQWSVALNGDISLGSQLLLQEQGFRLYPSFARCAITSLLKQSFSSSDGNDDKNNLTVDVTDYYMDTNYNSDPSKFEVKQVLLNIVLDTK
jgi:hypothetical protein